MHVRDLNCNGGEVISDRGSEVVDVMLLLFGCFTAWNH